MKLDHIDSLRGIAILMVMFTHVGSKFTDIGLLGELSTYGRLGVQLFFVVSALTLCISIDRRKKEIGLIVNFYIRRFFRIAPVYYLGAILYLMLGNKSDWFIATTFSDYFYHAIFIHALIPDSFMKVVPGGWSIGVEFLFYFIFPYIYYFVLRTSNKYKIILLFILSIAISFILNFILTRYLNYKDDLWSLTYWNFLNQLPVFILGIILYFLHNSNSVSKLHYSIPVLGFIIFTLLTASIWKLQPILYVSLVPITAGISFVFLYFVFSKLNFLNFSILRKIGRASFSMYIFHFLVVTLIFNFLKSNTFIDNQPLLFIISFFLVIFITLTIALFTEKHIEKKGTELGRYIINKINT